MAYSDQSRRHLSSAGAIIIGLVLGVWGVLSIVSPVRYITTVPQLDAILIAIANYLWIPALGVLFLSIGIAPAVRALSGNNRFWAWGATLFGVGFLCLGGFLSLVSLNSIAGALYVSPLPISGVVLLAAGSYDWLNGRL